MLANPAAIVLNGGELRSTAGLTFATNRGITVGPQGGTISYVGAATITLGTKDYRSGWRFTFDGDSYNGALTFDIANTTQDTYQGPTIIEIKNGACSRIRRTTCSAIWAPHGDPQRQLQSGSGCSSCQRVGTPAPHHYGWKPLLGPWRVQPAGLGTGTVNTTLTIGGTAASPVNQTLFITASSPTA